MKIKYEEFKKELEKKIAPIQEWVKSIEPGYDGDVDEEAFEEAKDNVLSQLDIVDYAEEELGEFLED